MIIIYTKGNNNSLDNLLVFLLIKFFKINKIIANTIPVFDSFDINIPF